MEPRVESRVDDVGGCRYHVLRTTPAQGPPVVCVHGFVVSGRYMEPLMRELAPDFTASTPDLPGFGRSDKPPGALDVPELSWALERWIRHTGEGPVPLVANSFGCRVAVDLAARQPDLVSRLVFVSPTLHARPDLPKKVALLLVDALREEPFLWVIAASNFASAGLRRTLRTFRYAQQDRALAKLPHVRCDTLVVVGDRDPLVDPSFAKAIAHALPKGRLAVLPGGPHALNYSRPRELAAILKPFLAGDAGDASDASLAG